MDDAAGWPGRVAHGARAFHEGLSWRKAVRWRFAARAIEPCRGWRRRGRRRWDRQQLVQSSMVGVVRPVVVAEAFPIRHRRRCRRPSWPPLGPQRRGRLRLPS